MCTSRCGFKSCTNSFQRLHGILRFDIHNRRLSLCLLSVVGSMGPNQDVNLYVAETTRETCNRPSARGLSRKAVSAVTAFCGWLQKTSGDLRSIETIPANELDSYLCTYFSTITKKDGSPYLPSSLESLRDGINRHLKEHGYPFSISMSVEFTRSQLAYRQHIHRLHDLKRQHQSAGRELYT